MTELCDLPATTLRRMIGDKRLSPVELLDSCIGRIEATNWDEGVVPHARDGDNAGLSALEGPDCGKGRLHDCRHPAGGVIVGKTNVPELLHGMTSRNPLFGTTHNAHDLELSCLGSSGGSAVAVSASMVPLASGSDTGGSIRGPAVANGICGMRPSPGVVPHDDHIHAFNSTSIRGPMARTVADTQLFLAGMVSDGPNPYDHEVNSDDILKVRVAHRDRRPGAGNGKGERSICLR